MATWQLPPQGWMKPRRSVAPRRDWTAWQTLAMKVMQAAAFRGRRRRREPAQKALTAPPSLDLQVARSDTAAA